MKTKMEEDELDTELQELYLESKQWITDLEYLDNELEFLKRLVNDQRPDAVRAEEFARLEATGNSYNELKQDMAAFLHKLEPLITHTSRNYTLDLIETYAQLQYRLGGMLFACHELRSTILDRSKEGFKKHRML
jgi:hypothetical protein